MLRIVAVGALLVALLITIKDQRVLQRAHLVGYCSTFASAADGSEWRKCVPGKLSGRPGLELNSCTDWGRRQRRVLELPRLARRSRADGMRRAARRRPFVSCLSLTLLVELRQAEAPGAEAVRRRVEDALLGTIVRPATSTIGRPAAIAHVSPLASVKTPKSVDA